MISQKRLNGRIYRCNDMAKKIKESHPISIRMEKDIFDRLQQFCEDSGQSKTVAIERAISMYIDDYDDKKRQLENL